MANIYETVTERIISALDAGVIPWKRDWRTTGKTTGIPYNLVSKLPYRGINSIVLGCNVYPQNGWCTYKQAQTLGYQVRKGEKSTPIIFWKFPTKAELLENPDIKPFARPYWVFNLAQLDGVPAELPVDGETFDPIAECDAVVSRYMESANHPTLSHGGIKAYFSPSQDHVQMPARESFNTPGGYYATLFHEFAHSTGIKSRCDRAELQNFSKFGDVDYSKEELTAEFAAAFLCAETGCGNDERINNSVAYIQNWIQSLKNDKTLAVQAAQRAQRASDYILGRSHAATSDNSEVAA